MHGACMPIASRSIWCRCEREDDTVGFHVDCPELLNGLRLQTPRFILETTLYYSADSMLDIAKFAICFANILMTGAAKPQGLFHFPEGES